MANQTYDRRQTRRLWALPRRRNGGRNMGVSPWYPQAKTLVEAGPVVTLPVAAGVTDASHSLLGTVVAWLMVMGGARHRTVPAAMAMGFGGPDLSAALFGETA